MVELYGRARPPRPPTIAPWRLESACGVSKPVCALFFLALPFCLPCVFFSWRVVLTPTRPEQSNRLFTASVLGAQREADGGWRPCCLWAAMSSTTYRQLVLRLPDGLKETMRERVAADVSLDGVDFTPEKKGSRRQE